MYKLSECIEILEECRNIEELLNTQSAILELHPNIPKPKLIAINRTITKKMNEYDNQS